MAKPEYHEGPRAGENFEKLTRAVFKVPKVTVAKKQPKARSLNAASGTPGTPAPAASVRNRTCVFPSYNHQISKVRAMIFGLGPPAPLAQQIPLDRYRAQDVKLPGDHRSLPGSKTLFVRAQAGDLAPLLRIIQTDAAALRPALGAGCWEVKLVSAGAEVPFDPIPSSRLTQPVRTVDRWLLAIRGPTVVAHIALTMQNCDRTNRHHKLSSRLF